MVATATITAASEFQPLSTNSIHIVLEERDEHAAEDAQDAQDALPAAPAKHPLSLELSSINGILRQHARQRLYVRPLYWTAEHLHLLGCVFIAGCHAAVGKMREEMAVNNKLTRPIERLAAYLKRGVGSEFKTVLVRDMLHRHGLSEAGTHDKFELRFAQRSVRAHLRTGGIFAPSPNAPPGLAFLDLDAVAKRRDLSVTYQIPHLTSRPVARILHKKLNRIRPIEEIYDPYIAAVLIALAQEQRRAGAVPDSCRTPPTSGGLDSDSSTHTPQDSLGPKVYLLATAGRDLHLYTACFPPMFLDRLDQPSQQSFADTVPLHHYHLTLKSPAQISDMISTMAKSMSRVPFRSGSTQLPTPT